MPSIRFRNTWTILPFTRFGVSITLEMPSLHGRPAGSARDAAWHDQLPFWHQQTKQALHVVNQALHPLQ